MYNQMIIFTQDQNGDLARNFISIQDTSAPSDSLLAAVATAYQACTSAKVLGWQKQLTAVFSGALSSSAYPTVFDRIAFQTKSSSQSGKLDLVAPLDTLFTASGYNAKMSDTRIIALVNALEAAASVGVAGNAILSVPSGKRYKVRQGGP